MSVCKPFTLARLLILARLQSENPETVKELNSDLLSKLNSGRKTLSLTDMGLDCKENDVPLRNLVKLLLGAIPRKHKGQTIRNDEARAEIASHDTLPKFITFPYSRHSSYRELCDLVAAFKPVQVYPCTVDELHWHEGS